MGIATIYASANSDTSSCGISRPGVYDTLECKRQMSNANTFLKQNAYGDAYASWRYTYCNCLKGENDQEWIYKAGADIFRHSIKSTPSEEKETLFHLSDSIITLYENWGQAYSERKASTLSGMATYMFLYQSDSSERLKRAREYFEESFLLAPENTSHSSMVYHLASVQKLLRLQLASSSDLAKTYLNMTRVILEKLDQTEIRVKKWQSTQNTLDRIISTSLPCSTLSLELQTLINKEPADHGLLKQLVAVLGKMNCSEEDQMPWITSLCALEPNAECKMLLGDASYRQNKFQEAKRHYQEAINLSDSAAEKSETLLKIAQCLDREQMPSNKILPTVNEAIALNPENGNAYFIKAGLYAQLIQECTNEFDQKAGYWVVVDYYSKAKDVDPDLDAKCAAKIEIYRAYYPEQEELFFQTDTEGNTLKAGMPYYMACLQEHTTIRLR